MASGRENDGLVNGILGDWGMSYRAKYCQRKPHFYLIYTNKTTSVAIITTRNSNLIYLILESHHGY